jgi:hypothetical protein
MQTTTLLDIGKLILDYTLSLDWTFIISFILLAYGAIIIKRKEKWKIQKRYLVGLVGLFYGAILSLIYQYNLQQVLLIFQSFVFAFVFHKLLIDHIVRFIVEKLLQNAK